MQTNPVKAIREKCLECSNGSVREVELCPVTGCALYPFRFGKNPYRTPRDMTEEQKKELSGRLSKWRSLQSDNSGREPEPANPPAEGKFTSAVDNGENPL